MYLIAIAGLSLSIRALQCIKNLELLDHDFIHDVPGSNLGRGFSTPFHFIVHIRFLILFYYRDSEVDTAL
jgi:hypothetical protein